MSHSWHHKEASHHTICRNVFITSFTFSCQIQIMLTLHLLQELNVGFNNFLTLITFIGCVYSMVHFLVNFWFLRCSTVALAFITNKIFILFIMIFLNFLDVDSEYVTASLLLYLWFTDNYHIHKLSYQHDILSCAYLTPALLYISCHTGHNELFHPVLSSCSLTVPLWLFWALCCWHWFLQLSSCWLWICNSRSVFIVKIYWQMSHS